jgi:SulP family sulfate permease
MNRSTRDRFASALPALEWLRTVDRGSLRADAFAGATGAVIVLPQAIAFAAIAGLPPQFGIASAIVVTIVAAAFGSSRHLVSGPTTPISILVLAALADSWSVGTPAYLQAAILLTLMVGVIQLGLGLARFGALVDFVSHSVMIGFTAGAGVIIGWSQIVTVVDPRMLMDALDEAGGIGLSLDWHAIVVAAVTVGTAFSVNAFWRKGPHFLIAMAAGTALAHLLDPGLVRTETVGALGSSLPMAAVPVVSLADARTLAPAALAIALIGLLEAVAIARALGLRSGQVVDANAEFRAQGLSNVAGAFFGAYAGSGSFTRSGINYEAGARTPLAAILSGLLLATILVPVAPLFAFVPSGTVAGIIFYVALRLVDVAGFRRIVRTSRSETTIAFATLATTVGVGLEFGVYVGVILSLFFFLDRTSRPRLAIGAPDPTSPHRTFRVAGRHGLAECPQLICARLEGPLYFGSVEHVRRSFAALRRARPDQKTMLFILKGTGEIDMSGAELVLEEASRRRTLGGVLHVQAKLPETLGALERLDHGKMLGEDTIHLSKSEALQAIVPKLDRAICARCTARVFLECPPRADGIDDLKSKETGSGNDSPTAIEGAS